MLKLTDVHKIFDHGSINEVYALRGVSLDIKEGEFVTIIGTNGSGKSTLLNAAAGTFLPDSGKVEIAGKDVTRLRDFQRAKYAGHDLTCTNTDAYTQLKSVDLLQLAADTSTGFLHIHGRFNGFFNIVFV